MQDKRRQWYQDLENVDEVLRQFYETDEGILLKSRVASGEISEEESQELLNEALRRFMS